MPKRRLRPTNYADYFVDDWDQMTWNGEPAVTIDAAVWTSPDATTGRIRLSRSPIEWLDENDATIRPLPGRSSTILIPDPNTGEIVAGVTILPGCYLTVAEVNTLQRLAPRQRPIDPDIIPIAAEGTE